MPWLILEARFLAGRYGGEEWPPAPMRLLQAFVAGVHGVDFPALQWLEQQGAPEILAERDPPQTSVKTWVPNNTASGTPATPNERTARERSVRRIEQTVSYCWPLEAEHDEEMARALIVLARRVHTLGTGHDMCSVTGIIDSACRPVSSPLQALWQPEETLPVLRPGVISLRVPVSGSLIAIEQRWQSGLGRYQADGGFVPPVLPPARHRVVDYLPSNEKPRCVALPMRLVAPWDERKALSWHPGDAVIVAGMLRHAAMAATADGEFADWAAGHAPEDDLGARLSWVPLPSIGHRHADRRIRRAIYLARPQEANALTVLHRRLVEGKLALIDQESGAICAIARPLETDEAERGVLASYLQSGRIWQSVSPVALPGDFAEDERRARKLVRKAIIEAGIDAGLIRSILTSKTPLHTRDVPLSAVKTKAWRAHAIPLRHVRVEFTEVIRGPLIIGRGRHFGLGILCANLQ